MTFKTRYKIKNNIITVLVSTLLFMLSSSLSAGEALRFCVSDINWSPFVIIDNDHSVSGIYIDMLASLADSTNYDIAFVALPWKRCLHQAGAGKYDGIAGVSYQKKRAEYLDYPEDVNTTAPSDFRLSQVEYVVVTMANKGFNFTGDIRDIPSPLRSPLGFSIGAELEKQGMVVDNQALSDDANIKKLLRDKTGSVILIREMAYLLAGDKQNLKIHDIPLKSKSYFLGFSKKSKLNPRQKIELWRAVKTTRDNKELILKFYEKYQGYQHK